MVKNDERIECLEKMLHRLKEKRLSLMLNENESIAKENEHFD